MWQGSACGIKKIPAQNDEHNTVRLKEILILRAKIEASNDRDANTSDE